MLDLDFVRKQFPALQSEWALFDNAGGSVPLARVIDRVQDYMRTCMVQLGASYALSVEAAKRVEQGRRAAEKLLGSGKGDVVIGPSSTGLTRLAAAALRPMWQEGDEVIVADIDHESNIGAWRDLEATGVVVREWLCDPETFELRLEDLEPLLNERTRLVAFSHCSNLVGEIQDVAAISKRVHEAGALVFVDGVAYAPHRRVDVHALGADLYVASLYKVYGPHMAAMHVGKDLLAQVASQNHFFVGPDAGAYKLEPGNVNHELTASLPGIVDYLEELDRHHGGGGTIEGAFDHITTHECQLAAPVLDYLGNHAGVRLLGRAVADARRAPTISFVPLEQRSSQIPPRLDELKIATRWGHFYAHRFCTRFGLHENGGVVRVSMVHYNSPAEVSRLLEALDSVL
ncbi:MAG: cysteine desulfurase family protein (TIGR01976 family) [Planctomycetota bacterium]|jgi:cysteine desulfurase family protein (TIGR01976 family)